MSVSEQLAEFAWLLLDQARIVEGEQLPGPPGFARRLCWSVACPLRDPPSERRVGAPASQD